MAHSGVPGASLLSSNPSYNPLGTFGTLLPDIGAAAGEIYAPGNPLSTAAFLTKGGFDLSQGSILPGLLQFGSAALPFVLPSGAPGGAGGTDAGATAATGSEGFGASLSDFLSNPSFSGAGNLLSSAGSSIANTASSGWNSFLNSIGLGNSAAPAAAAGSASSAPIDLLSGGANPAAAITTTGAAGTPDVGPLLLDSSGNFSLTGANPAAITATGAGGTAATPSIFDAISNFTTQHPYLTLGAGVAGSQLLSPLLSNITGGMTSQEKALLAAQQPAINAESELISSEETGNLPPGAEAAVSSALAADIANIKSRYAATGQSGSSAEATDIANAQQQAAANQFQIAAQATQTGLQAAGITSDVYNTLIQDQLTRQQQIQNAFSGFFDALGYGLARSQAA